MIVVAVSLDGRNKKCIHNFGKEISWLTTTWKTEKDMGVH
jgi:hypothetical protein